MSDKLFTWADLKKAVNKMPEAELKKGVRVWGVDRAFSIDGVKVLKEDYLDDGDSGSIPRSEAKKNYSPTEYNEYKNEVNYPKGTRILLTDEYE